VLNIILLLSKAAAAPRGPGHPQGEYPTSPTWREAGSQALRDASAQPGEDPAALRGVIPPAHGGEAEIAVEVVKAKGICETRKARADVCVGVTLLGWGGGNTYCSCTGKAPCLGTPGRKCRSGPARRNT